MRARVHGNRPTACERGESSAARKERAKHRHRAFAFEDGDLDAAILYSKQIGQFRVGCALPTEL